VLSRPVIGIDDSFCITLDPNHQRQVSDDVSLFAQSKVRELSQRLRSDESFEANAARVLLGNSEGTFLWVGFAIAELLKKRTRSQVDKAMIQLPKGLPAVFARMLQSIERDDRDNSTKLLICTSLTFRKLSLKALADILDCQSFSTISEGQATLDEIEICAPMLTFREHAVEFVHQSAKDYLLRDQIDDDPVLEGYRIKPEEAHLYLTRRCLRSLAEQTYLQHYSLLNWPKHARQLRDAATRLFDQEPSFFGHSSLLRDIWWRKYSVNFPGLPNVIPPRLHIACFIGLKSWARKILHEGRLFTETTQDTIAEEYSGGWLAMDYAAEGAAEDLVKLLLLDELNSKHSLNQLEAALRRAVLTERDRAVRLLLSLGADANATDIVGKPLSLHAAAFKNRAIEKLLAECGARCYVQTPHEQSRVGHDEHALFESGQNRRPPKGIVSVLTREE